jgi:hypothetical protein
MKAHTYFEELLPLYAAGQLETAERTEIKRHLAVCAQCQADLKLWESVSLEVAAANHVLTPPPGLINEVFERLDEPSRLAVAGQRAWQLLRAQVLLTQRELWPASAAVMMLGVITAMLSNHVEAVYFIAPLIAAASLTLSFGPDHDAAYELIMATPMSPWKMLLARLSIVSGYNLLLSLVAGLALLPIIPPGLLGTLILGWLGPMAFLSALALLFTLWIGTSNAIAITYILWIAQYVPDKSIGMWIDAPALEPVFSAYQQFWNSPVLLVALSAFLIGVALWSANRPVFNLTQKFG